MRKIKYRGFYLEEDGTEQITINNKKFKGFWVYGFYVCLNGTEHRIYDEHAEMRFGNYFTNWLDVLPETVGKYIEIEDVNEKEMYEGDIINFVTTAYTFKNCRIEYSTDYARYVAVDKLEKPFPMDKTFKYTVVGNIFENQELLK